MSVSCSIEQTDTRVVKAKSQSCKERKEIAEEIFLFFLVVRLGILCVFAVTEWLQLADASIEGSGLNSALFAVISLAEDVMTLVCAPDLPNSEG